MLINLQDIFAEQKKINSLIFTNHDIKSYKSVQEELKLALYVELGEMANEIRSFKYWSNKESSSEEVVIDEYADCMHFITSLCIMQNTCQTIDLKDEKLTKAIDKKEITCLINKLFDKLNKCLDNKKLIKWYKKFITLGYKLGFDYDKIKEAYYKKHEVNVKRQSTNY